MTIVAVLTGNAALAAADHSFVQGPFATGSDVTKACLQCHQSQARGLHEDRALDLELAPEDRRQGQVDLGKTNADQQLLHLRFPANEPRCTSCHAGYGWKDASFDFSKAENIDCLVCHDTTGTYKKLPTGAGHPAYQDMEFPPGPARPGRGRPRQGRPERRQDRAAQTCGACHFFGGGGDHIKHGDLDSSLTKPSSATLDVHMGTDGANMTCTALPPDHERTRFPGKALSVSASGERTDAGLRHLPRGHAPQGQRPCLNKHAEKVACQTCHIPTFARTLPTKVWWDWSTAGQDQPSRKDAVRACHSTTR
ncbi:MAG: hypothetical protein MZW92_48070 [Comamonadaceae bacterium]|nr:hypothetical protein [Comamonadaceae bacterium]